MATNPTNMSADEFISYLGRHGIGDYKQRGDEISFPCPFGGCDDDHRGSEEYHCGFNCKACTYHCFKCGADGNYITLRKYFGDYEEYDAEKKTERASTRSKKGPSLEKMVKSAHKKTRESKEVRDYFNGRGINNRSIDRFMLGFWEHDGRRGFMIPIFDKNGKIPYIKIRRAPEDESVETVAKVMGQEPSTPKYVVHPAKATVILVGEDELVGSRSSDVLICEGELDRIIAIQEGVEMPVVCGGGGAQTFKDEWIDALKHERSVRNVYICMDRDKAGEKGTEKLAKRIAERIPTASVYKVTLPFDDDSHADLTDYFIGKCGTAKDLFTKYAEYYCGAEPIDPKKFEELTVDDIANVLDSTIKYDHAGKVITFLAMLLAYTDSDQLNIMFNASSSTGKSYICHEVSKYFPEQDVCIYGKTTPTAFYYSKRLRKIDPETSEPYIDLSRRNMVFVEQPDTKLQENLRAVLSHEKRRVPFAITNKEKGGRNAAEEGHILGFPSTFFCSANTTIDEQEQTRCIILSPDSTRNKVLAGIDAYIDKSCHSDAFNVKLQNNEDRRLLIERVLYIKSLEVGSIDIDDSDYLKQRFIDALENNFAPSAMRGIHKFTALAKAMALINAPFRTDDAGKIVVMNKDVDEVLRLWKTISGSMVYGLSPQLFSFYKDAVLPAWFNKKKNNPQSKGVTLKEIRAEYYKQMGGFPDTENVRKQWIPTLEMADFIQCEKNFEGDRREKLIIPQVFFENGVDKKA